MMEDVSKLRAPTLWLNETMPEISQQEPVRCVMRNEYADVIVRWPVAGVVQERAVCQPCGQQVWDKISRDFSGTEACLCFTIMPLPETPQ